MERGSLLVTVRRHGIIWRVVLPIDLGARLLAWLTERRLWADPVPVFSGPRGPLSRTAIHQVLHHYRRQRKARRCAPSPFTCTEPEPRPPAAPRD